MHLFFYSRTFYFIIISFRSLCLSFFLSLFPFSSSLSLSFPLSHSSFRGRRLFIFCILAVSRLPYFFSCLLPLPTGVTEIKISLSEVSASTLRRSFLFVYFVSIFQVSWRAACVRAFNLKVSGGDADAGREQTLKWIATKRKEEEEKNDNAVQYVVRQSDLMRKKRQQLIMTD